MTGAWIERDTETITDKHLEKLGWVIDPRLPERNVFKQKTKTKSQQALLGNESPDYILYQSDSNNILAVLEVKRPQKTLDRALKQARGYAKKLQAPIILAFDGVVLKAENLKGEILTMNEEPLDDFPPEKILIELTKNHKVSVESSVIKNRDQLIKIFHKATDQLRKLGYEPGLESIYAFCSLIFIKIKTEMKDGLPEEYGWDNLAYKKGKPLLEQYTEMLTYFNNEYDSIFSAPEVRDPKPLEELIKSLSNLNLVDTEIDIKGEAYEYFLSRYNAGNKSVLGQFFTPRHVVKAMVFLLSPKLDKGVLEKVYDPFCGTGGMLTQCYKTIYKSLEDVSFNSDMLGLLKKEVLHGRDTSIPLCKLAKMNMVLIGDGHNNIENKDSLATPVRHKYDIVITNIPFNLPGRDYGGLYSFPSIDCNEACLHHCLTALKKHGRAAIIVPEGILYMPQYAVLRKNIMATCKVNAVIHLPRETFIKYTTARTAILFLSGVHNEKTKKIIYADIKSDGYSLNSWRQPEPAKENDLLTLIKNRDILYGKENNSIYPELSPCADNGYSFMLERENYGEVSNGRDYYLLKDLVEVNNEIAILEPDKIYKEPQLNSATNSIKSSKKKHRYGSNYKTNHKKRLIKKGDLVIGLLHTQSGNGLFAISDDEYLAESQLVCRIREDKIDKNYLVLMLKSQLPKLRKDDTVGRETYKPEEILKIKIPKPTVDYDKYIALMRQKEEIESEIINELKKFKKNNLL